MDESFAINPKDFIVKPEYEHVLDYEIDYVSPNISEKKRKNIVKNPVEKHVKYEPYEDEFVLSDEEVEQLIMNPRTHN